MTTQKPGRGREAQLVDWKGREAQAPVREESRSPPRGKGGVGRPTRRSGKGLEAHLEVREGLGGLPKGPEEVGRNTWSSKRGPEAHPEVREKSGVPP